MPQCHRPPASATLTVSGNVWRLPGRRRRRRRSMGRRRRRRPSLPRAHFALQLRESPFHQR
eukprot:6412456-Pyramimonas_sp.AAC.1